MPNRILRDGFVDSDRVSALSDWAHRFYSNLLVKCDDAGRIDGRLEAIRSLLFPLGLARRTEEIAKALSELMNSGLIICYSFKDKPFIQVTKWQRCGNGETSRFPWLDGSYQITFTEHETRDGVKQFVETSLWSAGSSPHADGIVTPSASHTDGIRMGYASHADGIQTVKSHLNTETETDTETNTELRGVPPPGYVEFWEQLPAVAKRRSSQKLCKEQWQRQKCESIRAEILRALELWKHSEEWNRESGKFIPGGHRWLKEHRWEVEPTPLKNEPEADETGFVRRTPDADELRKIFGGDVPLEEAS